MQNGLQIAKFLESHPKIQKVVYPLLETHPGYSIMKKQTTGFTGMLSFYLNSEDFDQICEFPKNLKLFKFGTSLGGIESLVDHFGGTMKIYFSKEVLQEKGYTENFFRMSVGIEDCADLIADLNQALEKLN